MKNLKNLISILLVVIMATSLVAEEGVKFDGIVIFRKADGNVGEPIKTLYTSDNGTAIYLEIPAIQPIATTYDKTYMYGANVVRGMDWATYDLAAYTTTPETYSNITDFVDAIPLNIEYSFTEVAKPMMLKNGENRLINWYRTRITGLETINKLPDNAELIAAGYLSSVFDSGNYNQYVAEKTILDGCKEYCQLVRKNYKLDDSTEVVLSESTWHTDAEWQGLAE